MSGNPSSQAWPALLLAPIVALGFQSLAYSLVTPSCARQDSVLLHAVALLALLASAAFTALAWRAWLRLAGRGSGTAQASSGDASPAAAQRAAFVALASTMVGALSTLVVFAMWLPIWLLPPCS